MPSDPFLEHRSRMSRWRTHVLGAPVEFAADSQALLDLAREAFAGTPPHRWPHGPSNVLHVELVLGRERTPGLRGLPPQPVLSTGAGLLCGHMDAHNFAVIDPRARRAFVRVSSALLRHRRLLRYELIEFAAVTLASRTQGLVPLHAGCVGLEGRGLLLIGSSGAGKSTLTLNAALDGLDFLAEDSVFVEPHSLRATGLCAFVHAHASALRLIVDPDMRRHARRAPVIQRRSGARKLEIDLRGRARFARRPLEIAACVVLSAHRTAMPANLSPAMLKRILRREQSYAVGQVGWKDFERRILEVPAFLLGRLPPVDAVAALRGLLREVA